jgi:translation initiation factor 2 beta subunit (eIF-2beta)/eIF-5
LDAFFRFAVIHWYVLAVPRDLKIIIAYFCREKTTFANHEKKKKKR